jgi:hypothetical protein
MGCPVGESNATLDNMNNEHDILLKKASLIKIAIDMHLRSYRVVRQIEHSRPQPAQKFEPPAFYPWLEKQRHLAERVVVCYGGGLLWV